MKTFDRICQIGIVILAIIVVATMGVRSVNQADDIKQLQGRVRVLENAYLNISSPEDITQSPYYKAIHLMRSLKVGADEVIAPIPNSPTK